MVFEDDPVAEPAADQVPVPRYRRRQVVLVVVACAAALISTGGWIASAFVKSPAQVAADTKPPPRTPITAPVTVQVLTSSIVLRGLVYPSTQYNITPGPVSGDIRRLVVSGLRLRVGQSVRNGDLLAEVSGQPLFTLLGRVPAYRDIVPGDTGADVRQLQDALRRQGLSPGSDPAGTFGPGTKEAVRRFYTGLGYSTPTVGAAADQLVRTAQAAVDADRATISQLTSAASAGTPAGRQQLSTARAKLRRDEQALAQAESVAGPMVPMGQVVFLPSFPSVVTGIRFQNGQTVSGPLLTITTGALAVTGQLPPSQAGTVRPGMKVTILSEVGNLSATGRVRSLGTTTSTPPSGTVVAIGGDAGAGGGGSGGGGSGGGGSGSGGQGGDQNTGSGSGLYVPLVVDPDAPLAAGFNGMNVRLTVDTGTSTGAVTTVPVAAVFTVASGQTEVTRLNQDGSQTTVPVTTGISANGYVQVTPVSGGRLGAGDKVVVGQ